MSDDEWGVVDRDAEMKNPPPRTLFCHLNYEALLEGRIEWVDPW
jgi:hypothetical protein